MNYIAQANYAQWHESVPQSDVDDFMLAASDIHQIAANSPGYVWRYTDDFDSSCLAKLFGVPRIVFNMSVWKTIEDLKVFSFKGRHSQAMRQRSRWFVESPSNPSVLWWIEPGNIPTAIEAKQKITLLAEKGPSASAFTFRKVFDPQSLSVPSD